MKRPLAWAVAIAALALAGAWGLKRFAPPGAPASSVADAPAPAAPRPVLLAAGDVLEARRVELASGVEITGTLKAVRSAFVKARVAGEIRMIAVREGESVREGQDVVQMDTTELDLRLRQAEENGRAASAQLEIAKRASANSRALVGRGFISSTALETALSSEAAAQANHDAALAAVEIARKARSDATLKAPLAGVVAQRLAQPGERISVDGRVLEIIDLSRLEIEAAVPAEVAARVRPGAPARLSVDGLDTALSARVARINPSAQPGTRALVVYLAVDPHPALRQGMFARGAVTIGKRDAIALPPSAVRIDQAQPYVLAIVPGADGSATIAQRAVQTGLRGERDGVALIEIASGVSEGDRVLAARAGTLRPGTPVTLPAPAKR